MEPINSISPDNSNIIKKTWYITGVTSGVGKALVETALKENQYVAGTSRDIEKLKQMEFFNHPNFLPLQVDIVDEKQVRESVEKTIERFGNLTHVVNCAGYGIVGAVEETTDFEIRKLFDGLLFGPLNVIRAVLPHMRSKKFGYIFNVSSISGFKSFARFGAYSAVKFAVTGVSEALAQEVKPFGINAASIILGYFKTNFQSSADNAFTTNLIPDYDTVKVWSQFVTPVYEKLVPGDVYKLSNLIIKHYANQSEFDYNLFLGPKDTFDYSNAKIKELQDQVTNQFELNSNVSL